jgi:hypothetical protein
MRWGAATGLLERDVGRGVTVQAGTRLLDNLLTQRVFLVFEHVGVPAVFAEIGGKRVALPHRLQADVFFDFGARDQRAGIGFGRTVREAFAAAVLRALHVHRFRVKFVLQGEQLGPDLGVIRIVVEDDGFGWFL